MSEYSVEAYFLSRDTIKQTFGSKDQTVLKRVLEDKSRIIKNHKDRFSGKTLAEAVADVIEGKIEAKYDFHNAFAAWAVIAETADGRPENPSIGAPFMSLYDVCEVLEEEGGYKKLLKVFRALNGEGTKYALPTEMKIRAAMPCIAYIESEDAESLRKEIDRMREELEDDADWTLDIDEPDELTQILDWLTEAAEKQQNICLVLDGDL
jgi:hypothetical protein